MFENMEPKKEKGVGNHKEINSLSNFIFEKISSNTLILLFNKDKEKIEPGEINKLLGESGELKFHVTENITEIRERRHVTAFSSNGFVLMLENKTQKIDSVRDPRAKYKLLNPDFISIEDGELDYDTGLRLLKEKSRTYQDSIEEEFFIKDNKETSWDFGKENTEEIQQTETTKEMSDKNEGSKTKDENKKSSEFEDVSVKVLTKEESQEKEAVEKKEVLKKITEELMLSIQNSIKIKAELALLIKEKDLLIQEKNIQDLKNEK